MKYLLYCVYGYCDQDDARNKKRGHLYWFNPRMICTVKSYPDDKLVNIQMADKDSFWCDLGGWETIIDDINTDFCCPKNVRIQEGVVTK